MLIWRVCRARFAGEAFSGEGARRFGGRWNSRVVEKQVLEQLIDTKLLLAKATDADKAGAQKTAGVEITAAIENAGSQGALDQQLKANGLTEADWRAKITQDFTAEAVLQRELNITVTDDEVKQYLYGHTADYEQPEMAHVSHILIFTVVR